MLNKYIASSEPLMMTFFFSVADGVALGAAVTTSKTEVEVIVFVAIMLHKVWVFFFGNLAWCEIEFVCPLEEGMFCLL